MTDIDESKVFSWQDIYEDKINEMEDHMHILTEKVNGISSKWERCINQYSAMNYYDRQAIMRILLLSTQKGTLTSFNIIFTMLERRDELLEELDAIQGINISRESKSYIAKWILFISKKWEIKFSDLAPYLINRFGKGKAKEHVLKEDILEFYGVDALTIWNSL